MLRLRTELAQAKEASGSVRLEAEKVRESFSVELTEARSELWHQHSLSGEFMAQEGVLSRALRDANRRAMKNAELAAEELAEAKASWSAELASWKMANQKQAIALEEVAGSSGGSSKAKKLQMRGWL